MNDINAKSNTYPFVEVVIYSEIVRSIRPVKQSRFSRQNHGEETRKAREHVYWFCRPGEGMRHSVKRNGDGNVALAGSARSRGKDGGGNISRRMGESSSVRGCLSNSV